MVPNGWVKSTLGQLFEFKNGLNTDKEQYGKGYKFVNVMDVFRNDVITEPKILGRVQITDNQLKDYKLSYGDVLFNRTSETYDEIAMTAVYMDNAVATFGGFVIRGRPKHEAILPSYSVYVFQAAEYRNQAIKLGQGAIRANIGQKDLSKVSLLIPPLAEQKKIAQILTTWDNAILTTEKLLEISQQQKNALMQHLLTGKMRFPEYEDEWKLLKLSSLIKEIKKAKEIKPEVNELLTVKLHNKGAVPSGKYPNPTEGGRPYYKRYAGELIIGRQNLHNGGIGIVGDECNGLIASNAISSFEALPNANIDFVYSLMSTKHFKFTIDNLASGTGQKEVGTNELLSLKVCVPSKQEQEKIASVLSIADKEIKALQDKINHLKDEKKALIQQLLTGKRRVKVIQ
jgi:type I restriction enzyme S subunit